METLVHREALADVYLREDGSAIVYDYAQRTNPMFIVLRSLPIIAVLAFGPLNSQFGWTVAVVVLGACSIGLPASRLVESRIRGPLRGQRQFAPVG